MKRGSMLAALLIALGACSNSDSPPSAPVPINTGTGWSDSPFISRDGQRLYFMYSRYNFAPYLKTAGANPPVLTGPDRPGLHQSGNPWDESDIYVATKKAGGGWSEPVPLGINGPYGDAGGMEIDNGNTFVWLQGNGVTANNVVIAVKQPNGSWGPATDPGPNVNDHTTGVVQDNPYLSPDGNTLVWMSNRAGGLGGKDLWSSTKIAGAWSTAVDLGVPLNTIGDEDQFWRSGSGADAYWNGLNGITHCPINGLSCTSSPDKVVIPGCAYSAEASMPDDGLTIYFGCVDASITKITIMFSVKQSDGSWGLATPVD
jgi:hypothetical protein